LESVYQDKPINFSFERKENSQQLNPIRKITWSITGWRRKTYMEAYDQGKCGTYAGKIRYFVIDRLAGLVIKTQEDWDIARVLYDGLRKA
jgi:hypothetical protein